MQYLVKVAVMEAKKETGSSTAKTRSRARQDYHVFLEVQPGIQLLRFSVAGNRGSVPNFCLKSECEMSRVRR